MAEQREEREDRGDGSAPQQGIECASESVDDAGFTARLKRQQGAVFAEDVEILEAQQRSIEANPDLKLRSYAIDSGGVWARRIIENAAG